MITLRRSEERGRAAGNGIDSRFGFSFADYHDPAHVRFSVLRVLNEDLLAPGAGFPEHPHGDMEIVTYLLDGVLEHQDSLGHRYQMRRGDLQCMTAGQGIRHSERNPSERESTHLFQIWLFPSSKGLQPEYQQAYFSDDEKRRHLRLLVSPDGRAGSVRIHQDVSLYATLLSPGQGIDYEIAAGRRVYLQLATGRLELDGKLLEEGDAAKVEGLASVSFTAAADSTELLLFDLP
ncbi:pirin family protein [Thiohalomonas denitrificans]|uniref:Pirin N-terminal domain-containing protein n=1 Tax=Thiohalomonas denitrificans TaxID=415747 RepID=A0A1G5Q5G0_9GAMM|nr:pirin family protein [Thiohalomonas denitrificans]SCZ57114.1 hypothetical protein SAMN03097708_01366 [Thiohalomonas denitrificans]